MIRITIVLFFFKQKTAYEMRISDWSSDVCSSDRGAYPRAQPPRAARNHRQRDPGSARSMTIHVALGARSYPIHIERGLLGRAADHLATGRASCRARVCPYV